MNSKQKSQNLSQKVLGIQYCKTDRVTVYLIGRYEKTDANKIIFFVSGSEFIQVRTH